MKQMSANDTWVSLSPANHSMIAWATEAVYTTRTKLDDLRSCWQSMLALPGWVLWQKNDAASAIWVFKSTIWGVLGWPVKGRQVKGHRNEVLKLWELDLSETSSLQFRIVTDLHLWKMCEIVVKSPAHANAGGFRSLAGKGIVLQSGVWDSLLTSAASMGFKGLTMPYLQKLYSKLGVKREGKRPSTVQEICKAMLEHCFPGETADQTRSLPGQSGPQRISRNRFHSERREAFRPSCRLLGRTRCGAVQKAAAQQSEASCHVRF